MKTDNIYIDETCHLEYDRCPVMCIGYIKIDIEHKKILAEKIKEIKTREKGKKKPTSKVGTQL